jgi:hypothetical protein
MELPFLKHDHIMKSVKLFGEQVIQPYKAEHTGELASAVAAS